MVACQYPGCVVELPPRKGRGRRAERCLEHRKARKREQDKAKYERDKARINSEKPKSNSEENFFPCCLDWQKAGRSNRTICPQHKQVVVRYAPFRASTRLNGEPVGQDRDTLFSFMQDGIGFRVSPDPDSWKPIDRHDKAQDKALAEWIDAGMPGAFEMKEIYANEAAARLSHVGRFSKDADARQWAEAHGYGMVEITAHRMPGTIANNSDKQLGQVQMKTYKSEAAAFRRHGVLMRKYGVCTGVVKGEDGCYHLLHDPDDPDLSDTA